MKDKIGGQLMNEFVKLKEKTYNYLKDNNDENKKAKGLKSVLQKENFILKIKKTVENQLKLELKQTILKKIKLT